MSSAPKKNQNIKKTQQIDDMREEPIPFLVYDSNTRSISYNYLYYYNLIIFRIHSNFPRRRCNKII